jgi:cellulose synthase/poly-beta-1,6-N-acetylglucosamine synthase-like glycosyltransferase
VTLISYLLAAFAIALAIPVTVFLIEVIAAVIPRRSAVPKEVAERAQVAILVPAHNESRGLLPTIEDIKSQMRAGDRLLVVADNCTDDTASVAAAMGVEVVERNDPQKVGKGYALDAGLRRLDSSPPEIVIIVDADCRVGNGAIDTLASVSAVTRRPVQALYLMSAPVESAINHRVAEFAWRVKNWVRPLGLRALGLPCQLMGTGMAFPWHVIRSANLATGFIVEDLKLGLDLTLAASPPLFCPSACVTSNFSSSAQGAASQRNRWEQGHLTMILATMPRLIYMAMRHGNWNLLALTLDMAVPPLSLLGLLVIGMLAVASIAALIGVSDIALIVSSTTCLALVLATGLAWLGYGRDVVSLTDVLSIPRYAARKLPLYGQFLAGRTGKKWIRTDRTK